MMAAPMAAVPLSNVASAVVSFSTRTSQCCLRRGCDATATVRFCLIYVKRGTPSDAPFRARLRGCPFCSSFLRRNRASRRSVRKCSLCLLHASEECAEKKTELHARIRERERGKRNHWCSFGTVDKRHARQASVDGSTAEFWRTGELEPACPCGPTNEDAVGTDAKTRCEPSESVVADSRAELETELEDDEKGGTADEYPGWDLKQGCTSECSAELCCLAVVPGSAEESQTEVVRECNGTHREEEENDPRRYHCSPHTHDRHAYTFLSVC